MGQKVNPHGLRVGVIKNWDSRWYVSDEKFGDTLVSDYNLREFLKEKLFNAGVSKIEIERDSKETVKVIIHCAKPGMIIGKQGAEIENLRKDVEKVTGKKAVVNVIEVKPVDLDAQLVAENICSQLERRIAFRRAMKQAIGRTMKAGAKGIKVLVSGRVGGAEIARSEKYSEGNVPLHTLRANIDYGFAEADTTYGKLGVKVWINHGEILDKGLKSPIPEEKQERRGEKRGKRDDKRGGNREDRRNNKREGRDNKGFAKAEAPKAVNPRVRKTPKVEAVAEPPLFTIP